MNYFLERAQEPSTWRGFLMLLTGAGVSIAPELVTPIVATGTGLAGLVGMFTGDNKK